jgi:hypothetical protein
MMLENARSVADQGAAILKELQQFSSITTAEAYSTSVCPESEYAIM